MNFPDNITIGYIALVDGQALISDVIELGTESKWSHVAMVLCDPSDITQTPTIANQKNWYCFESNTELGNNVHVIAWNDYIRNEKESSISVRPFLYEPERMPNSEFVKAVINKYINRPYENDSSELVLSAFRANKTENSQSFFCSELTALVLEDLGLLSNRRLADNYVPADFSTERPGSLDLVGVRLGNEVPLQKEHSVTSSIIESITSFSMFISQKLGFD